MRVNATVAETNVYHPTDSKMPNNGALVRAGLSRTGALFCRGMRSALASESALTSRAVVRGNRWPFALRFERHRMNCLEIIDLENSAHHPYPSGARPRDEPRPLGSQIEPEAT